MSKKRGREKRDINVELVEIYEDLADENEDIRLKAAKRLLSRATSSNEDLLSTFNKLLRGICSGRKAARVGFSVALVEFLTKHGSDVALASAGPSLEKRDIYLGRLFAVEAVLKSKIIFTTEDLSVFAQLLDIIFNLAKEKPWIREECGWVLLQALHILQGNPLGHLYAQLLVQQLHAAGLAKSLEGVSLWIAVRESFTNVKFPDDVFKHGDPLYRKEKSTLVRVLKEDNEYAVPRSEETKQAKSKGWSSSKLHFGWDVVLSSSLKEDSKRVSFEKLWIETVEDWLFANAASDNKKLRGFLLVQKYITSIPVGKFDLILDKNFCRCLVNQLAQKDRNLHAHARRTLKAMESRASSEQQAAAAILQLLLSTQGYVNFDKLTKTKTMENLIRGLPLSTAPSVIEAMASIIVDPRTGDDNLASSKRQTAADYLLLLVRSLPVPLITEDLRLHREVMRKILEVLTKLGYFDGLPKPLVPRPSMGDKTRATLQGRLISCLTHLMANDPEPAYHPYYVASVLSDGEGFANIVTLNSDSVVHGAMRRAWNNLSLIHNQASVLGLSNNAGSKVFECLFSMVIIQACSGESDAVSILEELQDCYQGIYNSDSTETPTSDSSAFVEIILSLVSKPSALFRRLAQQAFKTFAASIDQDGIESMCRVLQTKESVAGQDDLFDRDLGDYDPDMNRDSDSDSTASDVEEIEMEVPSDTTSSDDVASSDNTDGEDAEIIAFEKKLAEALGTRRADADATIKETESSDEDMDDEQMAALDPLMTTMFQERKKAKVTSKKKESNDARKNITQFKLRVLELVQIYLKREAQNPIALAFIHPLLNLVKDTSNQDVSHKASETIREFLKGYKLKSAENSGTTKTLETARELLPLVHNLAMSGGSNALTSTCSQASLLLAKVIVNNRGSIEEAWAVYSETAQKNLRIQKSKILTSFFADWWSWCSSARQAKQL